MWNQASTTVRLHSGVAANSFTIINTEIFQNRTDYFSKSYTFNLYGATQIDYLSVSSKTNDSGESNHQDERTHYFAYMT